MNNVCSKYDEAPPHQLGFISDVIDLCVRCVKQSETCAVVVASNVGVQNKRKHN